jgi:hypothetical protein
MAAYLIADVEFPTCLMLGAAVAVCLSTGPARGAGPERVEFSAVAGIECLQPTRNASDLRLEDFRAAETRWLDEHHPGWHPRSAKLTLQLTPDGPVDTEAPNVFAQKETLEVERPDGSPLTVCFDINLDEGKVGAAKVPHER